MSTPARSASLLMASLVLAPFASAQDGGLYSIALDNPSAGESMRRAVTGDFDGDFRRDVVVLVDGLPTVLWAPAVLGWSEELDEIGVVTDVAAVPATTGVKDSLVTVSAAGLVEWTWSSATGAFADTTLDSSATWDDAEAVRVADLDGSAPLDFVGIAANGPALAVHLRSGGSSASSKMSLSPTDPTLRAIEPVRWLSGSHDQVAVATDAELLIVEVGDGVLKSYSDGGDDPALAAVDLDGTSQEGIAWARTTGVNSNALALRINPALGTQEPDRNLGAYTARSLASGDFDGDGRGVLYVAGDFSNVALCLNQVTPSPAGSASSWCITTGCSYAVTVSASTVAGAAPGLLVTDLDGDGDDDALSTVDDDVEVTIQNNVRASETAYRLSANDEGEQFLYHVNGPTLSFNVYNLPPVFGTHVELTFRRELDPDAAEIEFDVTAEPPTYFSLANHDRDDFLNVTGLLGAPLAAPVDESEYVAVQVRVVELDPVSDEVLAAGHELAFVLAIHDGIGLEEGPGELPPVQPIRVPPPGGGGG